MNRYSTTFLRLAIFVAGVIVLAVFVAAVWDTAFITKPGFKYPFLPYIFIAGTFAAGVPYFIALFHGHKLLRFIETNNFFSELTEKSLRTIIRCAAVVGAVCTLGGLPFFYVLTQREDAPGFIILCTIIIGVTCVVAAVASVLIKVVRDAMALKPIGGAV